MKIAVYGIGKKSLEFLERVANEKKNLDIQYFIQTKPVSSEFRGKKIIPAEEIDYDGIEKLIIATDRSNYKVILEHLKQHSSDWINQKKKVKYCAEFLDSEWYAAKKVMPYVSIKTKDNLNFIALSEDNIIPNEMVFSKHTYSKETIDAFFELTEKYYGNIKGGYFLDLGANIGTTSIYVRKLRRPDLKIIAIEASKINWNLLRVNCILNGVEDIKVELFGLSDQSGTASIYYESGNMGGNYVVDFDKKLEKINLKKLDDYIRESRIKKEDIDYIWMDVEGFEPKVIKGALEILSSHKIAMIQEFTPYRYYENNTFDDYCGNIKKLYKNFIDVRMYLQGDLHIYSTESIREFTQEMNENRVVATDLFFL